MGSNDQPDLKKGLRKADKKYRSYLHYSGIGFQMAGIILLSVFGGRWLDGLMEWKFPVFTLALSLLGITGAMVFLFKQTGRKR